MSTIRSTTTMGSSRRNNDALPWEGPTAAEAEVTVGGDSKMTDRLAEASAARRWETSGAEAKTTATEADETTEEAKTTVTGSRYVPTHQNATIFATSPITPDL
jgi:hypothetical protein